MKREEAKAFLLKDNGERVPLEVVSVHTLPITVDAADYAERTKFPTSETREILLRVIEQIWP